MLLLSGAEPKAEVFGALSVEAVPAASVRSVPAASVRVGETVAAFSSSESRHSICHRQTLWLLCFVAFIEGADQQLLPATFSALEEDLGLSPSGLGRMSLAQSLLMATTSPFWGALADRMSRKQLLVYSCIAWALVTILLALASSTEVMLLLRCIHGAALSSLGPIGQSVVADITEPLQRGSAFGYVYSSIALGSIMSSLVGTAFANHRISSGVRGWRLVFCFVASLSLLAAVVIRHGMDEPPRGRHEQPEAACLERSRCGACMESLWTEFKRAFKLMYIPTFDVIVLQGVFGCIPWNAMGFMAMYLRYCGHSDAAAALVVSGMLMGRAVGGVLGGSIGDALARRSPAHGRPLTAQISVALGIPFVIVLVLFAPTQSASLLTGLSLVLGGVSSWCSAGVNRPILSEVVGPSDRASIIAWMAAVEGSSGALFGAPVVGLLAEYVFGYQKGSTVNAVGSLSEEQRTNNLHALSQSMLWCTVPAWTLCVLLFSMLHWTYGPDARHARHAYERVMDAVAQDLPKTPTSAERDGQVLGLRRGGASAIADDATVITEKGIDQQPSAH